MRLPLHSDAARALAIAATAERASLHSISEGGEGDRGALHRSGEAAAHAPRAAQGGARSWRQLERGLIGGGFSWRLRSCVFSADGRRVAVASNAGVVFVFEAERGRLIGVACHPLASTNDAEVEARHVTVTTHPGGPPSDSRGVSCWLRRALARARMVAWFPVSDRTRGGPQPSEASRRSRRLDALLNIAHPSPRHTPSSHARKACCPLPPSRPRLTAATSLITADRSPLPRSLAGRRRDRCDPRRGTPARHVIARSPRGPHPLRAAACAAAAHAASSSAAAAVRRAAQ